MGTRLTPRARVRTPGVGQARPHAMGVCSLELARRRSAGRAPFLPLNAISGGWLNGAPTASRFSTDTKSAHRLLRERRAWSVACARMTFPKSNGRSPVNVVGRMLDLKRSPIRRCWRDSNQLVPSTLRTMFPKRSRHCDAELVLRFGQNLLNGFLERFDGLCAGQQVAIIKDDRRH